MKNKKFVIIDALAMAYKAYYAFINRGTIIYIAGCKLYDKRCC